MSDEQVGAPVPRADAATPRTGTLIVPPRPALPPSTAPQTHQQTAPPTPPLPPGWTVPTSSSARAASAPPTRSRGATPPPPRARSATFWPRVLLGAYVFVLAVIALWPSPVDGTARPLLRLVSRVIPMATYVRIEFGANILLFVPLGVLLALILQQRYLVIPIAFLATVAIESIQALMIDKRVPSVMDIIANVAGACLGLVIVALVEWRRARRE